MVSWTPSPRFSKWLHIKDLESFGMQAALGWLNTFHNNNQILNKSAICLVAETAANFTEFSRKHVLTASNRNIIENKV